MKADQQRLDAVIFAHEYTHIGSIFSTSVQQNLEQERTAASCATFLLFTSLLPALLVAPVERDIRLITMINPFYAAAAPNFSVTSQHHPGSLPSSSRSSQQRSIFVAEGQRALRTAILMRHLQRVLDALPSGSQVPRTDVHSQSIPVIPDKVQRSNIVAVSVSPGFSRTDIIAPFFGAHTSRVGISWRGLFLCALTVFHISVFPSHPLILGTCF